MRARPLFLALIIRAQRRPIAALLLLLYLPACTSWQGVGKPSPEEFLEDESPAKIRVTQTDGSRVELDNPWVSASDSLVGTVKGGAPVSIALSEVQKVEVSKGDTGMTVYFVLIVVTSLAFLTAMLATVDWNTGVGIGLGM